MPTRLIITVKNNTTAPLTARHIHYTKITTNILIVLISITLSRVSGFINSLAA